ncbi:MAG: carbamoyltransferase HypF [Candidatus Manganitrophaceae bacterium]
MNESLLLIGIGNDHRGDDGVGRIVARRLKGRLPSSIRTIEMEGEGTALLEAWKGADRVILVDATRSGAPPGTLSRIDLHRDLFPGDPLPTPLRPASTHAFGIAEAIELGRALNRLPPDLLFYGIEGKNFENGVGLSPEVEKGADALVQRLSSFSTSPSTLLERLRIVVHGAVQGVGFRPFVYRLATELKLGGSVYNKPEGVLIEIEGAGSRIETFLNRIKPEAPPHARIEEMKTLPIEPVGESLFTIGPSDPVGLTSTWVLPDLATCPDCLRELFDAENRRHRYPFLTCTQCGPRYTILEALPYDRAHTTMKKFPLCPECLDEYVDPSDRRFHAEAIACPRCGPQLELWGPAGDHKHLASDDPALQAAAEAIRAGQIVAVKGLGGFHLIVDARNEPAVHRLRLLKRREKKPFALIFPTIEALEAECEISPLEEELLLLPAAPIVLLRRKQPTGIAPSVAPDLPILGAMLPYTPLHHLLTRELGFPIVATSGNRSDEPICTDEQDALHRLDGIADLFLVHNRPIARPVDDSIVRIIAGEPMLLRRARGYAPLPFLVDDQTGPRRSPLLAVGGHLKNTIALFDGHRITLSQHIGNLGTAEADALYRNTVSGLIGLYGQHPATVLCDLHPDYHSSRFATQFAKETALPVVPVQHHYAHVLSCMAEHELEGPLLGIAWDGAGAGLDGTLWGGEFLRITETSFQRAAHLMTFPLPGGEKAMREPRRAAIGLLYQRFGSPLFEQGATPLPLASFSPSERAVLKKMLEWPGKRSGHQQGLQAPITSSAGRLFDAVASLLGLRQINSFEGEAAMALEFAAEGVETKRAYPVEIKSEDPALPVRARGVGALEDPSPSPPDRPPHGIDTAPSIIDWRPMIDEILNDLREARPVAEIAATFHNTLAEIIMMVARQVGEKRVVLTGGCFQNKVLTERALRRLREEGFQPYRHRRVPPNDGGLAVGQIVAGLRIQEKG